MKDDSTSKVKYEWRKVEKDLYLAKASPQLIDIPSHQFITLYGEGNPNSEFFGKHIEALYSVAYGIKMLPKKEKPIPDGYYDYTVYPLEGIWDITDEAKKINTGVLNKDDLVFNLMIRQPDFVKVDFFEHILNLVKVKKPQSLLKDVKFEKITDGRCIQMLHVGPYEKEPITFKKMETFAKDMKLERKSKVHREIYLSDFRRTAPEKLKTVLRFQVK